MTLLEHVLAFCVTEESGCRAFVASVRSRSTDVLPMVPVSLAACSHQVRRAWTELRVCPSCQGRWWVGSNRRQFPRKGCNTIDLGYQISL